MDWTQTVVENLFPLMIVTASLFVDRTLIVWEAGTTKRKRISKGSHRYERISCQIGFWIALILSISQVKTNEASSAGDFTFQTWLYLTIFTNVASISVETSESNKAEPQPLDHMVNPYSSMSHHDSSFSTDRSRRKSWFQRKLKMFSLAAWFAAAVSSLDIYAFQGQFAVWTIYLFLVTFSLLTIWDWYRQRKARIAREVQGIPVATTFATGDYPQGRSFSMPPHERIDESGWFHWNVLQTMQWLRRILQTNTESEEMVGKVLERLAPHQITGDALETITISELVQLLEVPYGPATRLVQAIQRLKAEYPRLSSGATSENSWSVMYDQEYNNTSKPQALYAPKTSDFGPSLHSNHEHTNNYNSNSSIMPMDRDHGEKLGQVMKERFGLELPTIKPPVDNGCGEINSPTLTNDPRRSLSSPSALHSVPSEAAATATNGHHEPSLASPPLPEAILAQMPPNVREVAERRPDLFRHLMARKRQGVQRRTRSSTLENGMIPEEIDDLSDDETTQLIQRQPRPKYESTEKDFL